MLFYLTDSLIIGGDDERYKDIYRCVRNLANAADECRHELMGDLSALNYWHRQLGNDPAAAVLANLINSFSTTSIPGWLTEYVEVVLNNPHNRVEGDKQVYQLEYGSFTSCESTSSTHIIGEDENDGRLYGHILNWYKRRENISANTSYTNINGGGRNTRRTFTTHIGQRHISVCIVDNDKRYRDADEGETAKKCRAVGCSMPLGRLKVINVLEIENLIPKDIIDNLEWTTASQRNKDEFDGLYENIPDKDMLRYVDLKSGYTKHKVYSQNSQWVDFAKYCCQCNPRIPYEKRNSFDEKFSNANDSDVFMHGLSRTLHRDALAYLDSHPDFNPTNFLQFQLQEWEEIGKMTLNTCICRNAEALNI